jgi:hypothetical protein
MKIKEIDAISGEVIERDMTAEEIAQRELEEAERAAKEEAQQSAKNAILDRLGITTDEAKLLLS